MHLVFTALGADCQCGLLTPPVRFSPFVPDRTRIKVLSYDNIPEPLKRDVIDPAPVAHVTAPYTTLDRVGGCEAAAS